MKILYVLGFLPPYVTREIEAVVSSGHEISVLLPEPGKKNTTADFWNGISNDPKSNSVTVNRTLEFKYLTCSAKRLIVPLLKSLRFLKTMVRSLQDKEFRYFIVASSAVLGMDHSSKPDIIHAHFAHDNAHIARIIADILKIPYSITTHAADIFVPDSAVRLRRVLQKAAVVFTISQYNVSHLIKYGIARERIVVARLGLDTSELPNRKKTPPTPLAVCTASGLVSKKGVPVLIEAMRLVQKRRTDFTLTVIGADPDGKILTEYRRNNTDLPINFTGVLGSDETLSIVSAASFFVLPCIEAANGDKDGIPVALMEAMGMGIPCISTRVSGIPELIENNISGILVKSESPEELADAMDAMLSRREKADRLGNSGREKILANHAPSRQAHILVKNFARIAAERK
ncbi:MAG: glycosyltransferase family 4 protein [Candidatus Sabulitectum sp.]|nr:glycosyltransferase family 4 protein [Candidatus Sabulitectum sp.]